MDLGEAIGAELDAARGRAWLPAGEQLGAAALLAEITPAFANQRAAAAAVGIDRRTLQRIKAGTSSGSAASLAKLRAAYAPIRSRRMAATWGRLRGQLADKGGRLAVKAVFCVSQDCRRRTIQFRNVLTAASRRAVIGAWEAGDPDAAAYAFNAAIGRDYCPGMYVQEGSVEWIRWG